LSEHIVFALEALPLGIFGALVVVIGPLYFKLGRRIQHKARTSTMVSRRTRIILEWVILGGIFAGTLIIVVINGFYALAIGSLALVAVAYANFLLQPATTYGFLILGIWLTVCGVVFAGATGWQNAADLLGKGGRLYTINNDELSGKPIMAGERGLLFYDNSLNRFEFLRWERIHTITRKAD
jgi:hypothetical protein